jgi:hypothetical protein
MYIWKLWRDSRSRVLSCMALGLLCMAIAAYYNFVYAGSSAAAWKSLCQSTSWPVSVVGLLASLLLANSSLGHEFSAGRIEFLLTLPRPRYWFVWVGWLFSLVQVFAVTVATAACGFVVTLCLTGSVGSWHIFAVPVLDLPWISFVVGIGSLVSVCSNGRNGVVAAFGIVFLYAMLDPLLWLTCRWELPTWWFDQLFRWAKASDAPFPLLLLIFWMIVMLAFPFLAQLNLQRKEIAG